MVSLAKKDDWKDLKANLCAILSQMQMTVGHKGAVYFSSMNLWG